MPSSNTSRRYTRTRPKQTISFTTRSSTSSNSSASPPHSSNSSSNHSSNYSTTVLAAVVTTRCSPVVVSSGSGTDSIVPPVGTSLVVKEQSHVFDMSSLDDTLKKMKISKPTKSRKKAEKVKKTRRKKTRRKKGGMALACKKIMDKIENRMEAMEIAISFNRSTLDRMIEDHTEGKHNNTKETLQFKKNESQLTNLIQTNLKTYKKLLLKHKYISIMLASVEKLICSGK